MEKMRKFGKREQRRYNQGIWNSTLEPGDQVLVRNLTPGKLCSYWEHTVYVVKRKKGPKAQL